MFVLSYHFFYADWFENVMIKDITITAKY